jgi:alpha-beta hydrolase superfamily lysophospholipase
MTVKAHQDNHGSPARFVDVAFPSLDGTALMGRFWTVERPRGILIIAHGLGEHSGSYDRLASELGPRLSIDILGVDFRGSGRSAGKRGVVRTYSDLSTDLAAASEWVGRERPGLPKFLLGHSNGGLVSLRTVLDRDLGLSGLIVSNPSLKLIAHVPVWKRLLGEVLLRVAPRITLQTGLSNDQLTHDPEVIAQIADDPLRHNRISPPLFFGMTTAGPVVLARAGEVRTPTLMIIGGSDPIIDPEFGRLFFEKLGATDKTLKVYDEMRHEPLNEVGRDQVLADLSSWIDERLKLSAQ